jgi:hypothetical protein
MASAEFPKRGTRVRRKVDGQIGVVHSIESGKDLLTVRWSEQAGFNTIDCTSEQFFRDWEVTNRQRTNLSQPGKVLIVVAIVIGIFAFMRSCSSGPSIPSNPTTSSVDGSLGTQRGANAPPDENASNARLQEALKSLKSSGALYTVADWLSSGRGILRAETLTNNTYGKSELVATIRLADFTDDPVLAMQIAMLDMDGVMTREAETGSDMLVYFHVVKEAKQLNTLSDSDSTNQIDVIDIVYVMDEMKRIDVRNLPEAKESDMGSIAHIYPLGETIGKSYCNYDDNRHFTPKFCSSF